MTPCTLALLRFIRIGVCPGPGLNRRDTKGAEKTIRREGCGPNWDSLMTSRTGPRPFAAAPKGCSSTPWRPGLAFALPTRKRCPQSPFWPPPAYGRSRTLQEIGHAMRCGLRGCVSYTSANRRQARSSADSLTLNACRIEFQVQSLPRTRAPLPPKVVVNDNCPFAILSPLLSPADVISTIGDFAPQALAHVTGHEREAGEPGLWPTAWCSISK